MTGPPDRATTFGFDAFSMAVGLAVIAGGLSLLRSDLDGLVAALAALAVAGAVVTGGSPRAVRRWRPSAPGAGALVVFATGGGLFLAGPALIAPWRGLLLGVSLLPWWLVERRRRRAVAALRSEAL